MTIQEIKAMVEGSDYDFLRTNEHLKDKILFLTLGGSYAYGTNTDKSDVDVRGCAMNSKTDIFGLSNFEQVVDNGTDTVVYSFNKLISLLINCNPNTIELLGCKPEQYMLMTPLGQEMIDNQKLFLSRRAVHAFGGYANQQLRRLETAIARDAMPQGRREEHVLNSAKNMLIDTKRMTTDYPDDQLVLYVDESHREELDKEIYADIHLVHYPIRDFKAIVNNLTNVIGTYDKVNHRNHKKDDDHLDKHAMHLVRLYLMCFDILEKEQIVTYRENDLDLLRSIRVGKFRNPDGTYQQEFFDMISEFEKRLEYDKENTSLPKNPNMKRVEEFVMHVNETSIVADSQVTHKPKFD